MSNPNIDRETARESLREDLLWKIRVLNEVAWKADNITQRKIDEWLSNFSGNEGRTAEEEQLHALHLLSQFLFYGSEEVAALLKAMYHRLYQHPIVTGYRKKHNDTTNLGDIERAFFNELTATRFVQFGQPGESSSMLTYYFRSYNELPKDLVWSQSDVFNNRGTDDSGGVDPAISRYVFIDDLCGSGQQAVKYSKKVLSRIKEKNSAARLCFYTILATTKGLENVRENSSFDEVSCIFELDETYECFSSDSRYFETVPPGITKSLSLKVCKSYFEEVIEHPLGFGNCQLLLGFHYNTPDNSLPIFWYHKDNWTPIFKRHSKLFFQ